MILLIEDDPAIRRGIADYLRLTGFETVEASRLADATVELDSAPVELVLLDLILPDGNGLDWLDELRKTRPGLPVIILTALGEQRQLVAGLDRGADDYIVKPFSLKELRARITAVLRRAPVSEETNIPVSLSPAVQFDFRNRKLIIDGKRFVPLTDKESAAFRYLTAHANSIVGRDELLRCVWGFEAAGTNTRTVDICIARLRDKLPDGIRLVTVRGQGYVYEK